MSLPPPTYEPLSQQTQLLISPAPDAVQFQKGFLGAQGERAAIEGELQIKGAEVGQWETATVSLETIESTPQQSIEISSSVLVLFSSQAQSSLSTPLTSNTIPSTLPFSIPLTPDTPQCIHTPHSSISHRLVATLHPRDRTAQPLSKSMLVHTRRYTSPNRPMLQPRPQTMTSEDPVPIKVEIPRATFRIGEPIAVYITIPPPPANVVTTRGLMLRNIMVELVRVVNLAGRHVTPDISEPQATTGPSSSHNPFAAILSDAKSDPELPSPEKTSDAIADGLNTTLTRSGSSCRFHTSRAVQIRLLLYPHQSALRNSDNESRTSDQVEDDDSDCASITQSTLLHTVTFHLAIKTTFLQLRTHSESVTVMKMPIVLLPNPAPLPEMDESVASEYRKKHDRPPARTVRHHDADILENEAGPSAASHSGAPPPFEERDAPPPFFSDSQPSTSHLPTFLESESEHIAFSIDEHPSGPQSLGPGPFMVIPGEGTDFGFIPNDQYDGISSSLDRASTPPPTIANADLDTDVSDFANFVQPENALESLSISLEHSSTESDPGPHADHVHPLPPPPPPLDDPSDPPPSIDVEEFRRPAAPLSREQSPQPLSVVPPSQDNSVSSMPQETSITNAPPPYLHSRENDDGPEGAVTRPPPYIDVLPEDPAL